jgi:hypothetical protein
MKEPWKIPYYNARVDEAGLQSRGYVSREISPPRAETKPMRRRRSIKVRT